MRKYDRPVALRVWAPQATAAPTSDNSPSHTYTCPEGITRSTVPDLSNTHRTLAEVRDISLPEIERVDDLFCTGTMGGLTPVFE